VNRSPKSFGVRFLFNHSIRNFTESFIEGISAFRIELLFSGGGGKPDDILQVYENFPEEAWTG
jgi:hypothetical protein